MSRLPPKVALLPVRAVLVVAGLLAATDPFFVYTCVLVVDFSGYIYLCCLLVFVQDGFLWLRC
jgi:hypothetical protein